MNNIHFDKVATDLIQLHTHKCFLFVTNQFTGQHSLELIYPTTNNFQTTILRFVAPGILQERQ